MPSFGANEMWRLLSVEMPCPDDLEMPAPSPPSSPPRPLSPVPDLAVSEPQWPPRTLQMAGNKCVFLQPDADTTHRGFEDRLSGCEQAEFATLVARVPRSAPLVCVLGQEEPVFIDTELSRASKWLKTDINSSRVALLNLVADSKMSVATTDNLLKILGHPHFHARDVEWKNSAQMKREVDKSMPKSTAPRLQALKILGTNGQPVNLLYRDGRKIMFAYHTVWETCLQQFRDPLFAASTALFPEPQYDPVSGARQWGSFSGGLLFAEMYNSAPPNHLVLAIILASDEASYLSSQSAWAAYSESAQFRVRLPPPSLHTATPGTRRPGVAVCNAEREAPQPACRSVEHPMPIRRPEVRLPLLEVLSLTIQFFCVAVHSDSREPPGSCSRHTGGVGPPRLLSSVERYSTHGRMAPVPGTREAAALEARISCGACVTLPRVSIDSAKISRSSPVSLRHTHDT